jgi:hypothetical protein
VQSKPINRRNTKPEMATKPAVEIRGQKTVPTTSTDLTPVDSSSTPRAKMSPTEFLLDAEGGFYWKDEAVKLLNIDESLIEEMRKKDEVLGFLIDSPEGEQYVYPKWQFDGGSVIPGLREVLLNFPDKSPWARASFLLNSHLSHSMGTPIAGLKKGRLADVLVLVHHLDEQGAL